MFEVSSESGDLLGLLGRVYKLKSNYCTLTIQVWGGLGACSTATIQGLYTLGSADKSLTFDDLKNRLRTLGSVGVDSGYKPKRFFFVTTDDYIKEGGKCHYQYVQLYRDLVENSKLLETFKNHSHDSSPNHLYMLDLG